MQRRSRAFAALTIAMFLVGQGRPVFAQSDAQSNDCISIFYRTKDAACLNRLIASLDKLPPGVENGTFIGFFAALFDSSPELRQKLLDGVPSDRAASTYLAALRKAGLVDEAQRFAASRKLEDATPPGAVPLKTVVPVSVPLDNDLLLGAYMATGDLSHIDRILENLRTSRDGMAADAIRIGLIMGKFGGAVAPGRPNIMIVAACRKYGCPRNQPSMDMMRSLTIASAVWALQSIAKNDVSVKKELNRFFQNDPHLAAIFTREQSAFANYLTLVGLWSVKKDGSLDAVLTDYERLGAADALLEPDKLLKSLEDKK
ncbi:hypothetical protein [Mesorhizobium sp. B1-1-8]|uniref:hypothetical protein n=1 Tax=Mesorhizobium sp. B1-1-8 TaxID=2589976 RepID=UPI00112DAC8B|nr:hypothetical protein [Mesorhizobium sp. B1-1-8]UCI08215.1 hypothetical protein FJ974_03835 [Mesorhizobium sp. B1-1-8]